MVAEGWVPSFFMAMETGQFGLIKTNFGLQGRNVYYERQVILLSTRKQIKIFYKNQRWGRLLKKKIIPFKTIRFILPIE
jgi:hypothetical protein